MSLLVFTGGSQFAAVSVIAAGGAAATAVANALLLAVRNGAYGLSLASLLRGSFPRRAVAAQLVIDETTAMARAQESDDDARGAFWLTGAAVFVCWNAGTLAGALAGSGLGDPAKYGLDAMFPAAFLALLAPQLRQPGAPAAALAGALIAVVLLPLTPAGRAGDRGEPRRARGPAEARVSWAALLALAGGSYALKAAGPLLLGDRDALADGRAGARAAGGAAAGRADRRADARARRAHRDRRARARRSAPRRSASGAARRSS